MNIVLDVVYVLVIVMLGYLLTMKAIPRAFVWVGRRLGFRLRLTPLTERRLQRFKHIRRGYWCFVFVCTAFVLSLFLELYVNNKALYISYTPPPRVKVEAKAGDTVLYQGEVQSGESFTIAGKGKDGTIGGEVSLLVDGWPVTTIRTGEADRIDLGHRFGSFVVRSGEGTPPPGPTEGAPHEPVEKGVWGPVKSIELTYDARSHTLYPAVAEWLDLWIPFVNFAPSARAVQQDFGLDGHGEVVYRDYARWVADPSSLEEDAKRIEKRLEEEEAAERAKLKKTAEEKGLPYDPNQKLPVTSQEREARQKIAWDRHFQKVFASGRASIVMPLYPFSAHEQLLELAGAPPHPPFSDIAGAPPLGTDEGGRDVLAQILYGFRISFSFAVLVAVIGFAFGIAVGAVMGYYGGWTDILVQRVIEVWGGIPFLFVLMIVGSIYQPSFAILALLLVVLTAWVGITFLMRGEYYREKARDYVQAARALGARSPKIMARHILPNALVPVVTFLPFAIVGYIGVLVSLDYLGFGLPPGTPSWGNLLKQGAENITNHPTLVYFPVLAFAGTLFCVVMVGEAVREAFDPKLYSRLR